MVLVGKKVRPDRIGLHEKKEAVLMRRPGVTAFREVGERGGPRRLLTRADSSTSSSQHPRTYSPGTRQRPRARASGSLIGEAYSRFLEMPVPVVLAAMWLLGALALGVIVGVLMVMAYGAYTLLLAAIALV